MKIKTKKYEYILFERRQRAAQPIDEYVYPPMWRLLRWRQETMRVYTNSLPLGRASAKIHAIKHLRAKAQARYSRISLKYAKEIVEKWLDRRRNDRTT